MPTQKIAILGGGVGSVATAWELTNVAGWRDHYEITVYQMGWRLGGKGASGRNAEFRNRIQEHGLHLWMGFYENAFRVMREVYEYCHQHNLMPDSPFQSYKDAFSPIDVITITELFRDEYFPWTVAWPETDSWPAEGAAPPGVVDQASLVWYYVVRLLELLTAESDRIVLGLRGRIIWAPISHLLREIFAAARALSPDPRQHSAPEYDHIAGLIDRLIGVIQDIAGLAELLDGDQAFRRLNLLVDIVLAVVRGLIRDDIINRGFSSIDGLEFRDWLASHGCRQPQNSVTAAFYDACFAYVGGSPKAESQNMAAGTMLNGLLRLLLAYNKSIMLAMNAGMGDTIFAPLYLALKDRGVRFEFFHRVTSLGISADHANVDVIHIDLQATPNGDYNPLVQVKGVECWPSEPRWEQLVEGNAILQTPVNHDLESSWCAFAPVGHKMLTRGVHFDIAVNGISLGAIPFICQELIDVSPDWKAMIARVLLVRTQAFQLWLHATPGRLGWNPGPTRAGVLTGFVEPFDTWADMHRLIPREDFTDQDECHGIAYFCNALADDPEPAPFTDPAYPDTQTDRVRGNARRFLDRAIFAIWPHAVDRQGHFRQELLVNVGAGAAFDNQFFRANVEPSELYVLSTAGSISFRLAPGKSGFQNLILAGDWTLVELNVGCVEAAVQSGMMASNAICGAPQSIAGAFGITLPVRNGALA